MGAKNKLKFLVVDDDQDLLDLLKLLISEQGHSVITINSSKQALEEISTIKPDCIISDLMMPDLDGLDLFRELKKIEGIKQPTFIIVTSKSYEFDRKRARVVGVDGYINKPINAETFMDEINAIIDIKMEVEFWGVRGTLPVPGKKTVYYGGNTNCVTLRIGQNYFFVFDAGTGIKALADHLRERGEFPISAKIFISHPHWDHINGLPFFDPLYMAGNEFEIFGANHAEMKIENIISNQMASVYFPITINELASKITFHSITAETINLGAVQIKTMLLNHPGYCLGFRVEYKDKSFCYITDNEIYPEDSKYYSPFEFNRLVDFIHNTDLLVIDATYSDEEYAKKMHWGHSSISRVVDLIDKAKVKIACLHHHDPSQFDVEITNKFKLAKSLLKDRKSKTKCLAPREGDKILV